MVRNQKQLALDVCSSATIKLLRIRICQPKGNPILQAVLDDLGYPQSKFFSLIEKKESSTLDNITELESCLIEINSAVTPTSTLVIYEVIERYWSCKKPNLSEILSDVSGLAVEKIE